MMFLDSARVRVGESIVAQADKRSSVFGVEPGEGNEAFAEDFGT